MKKNLKAFGSVIDVRQILIGPPVQLFGYLAYLIFPPPDQTYIPHKSSISIILHSALPHFFVKIVNGLLFLIQIFSFILITTSWLLYLKIDFLIICISSFLRGCNVELGKIFNSSFLKRIPESNLLSFINSSIIAFFIFFISILPVNVGHNHFANGIYKDDCFIGDTVYDIADDDSALSTNYVFQFSSYDFIIFTAPTKNVFINPYDLTLKVSARAPPA